MGKMIHFKLSWNFYVFTPFFFGKGVFKNIKTFMFLHPRSWMAVFKQDWVDWAANIPSAQASPPKLGIVVHLIMLKSGMAKGLGNFELCETCAHDLSQHLLIRETLERVIHTVCGRVHNYCCASKQHQG